MELSQRPKDDRYTPPGRYGELETAIRAQLKGRNVPTLIVYAFDRRTRLGPFLFVDKTLIPGAPRALASAMYAAGFATLRVVLQQWSPNVRPSRARFDGRPPELLLVSSMQIHSASAYRLIRDAWELGDQRPLILAGGPKGIYEPWDFFGLSDDGRVGADVVVTGEEFVALELLQRLLEQQRSGEHLRRTFERLRSAGLLEDIPGLVYAADNGNGEPPTHLIDTGVQRIVQNQDELPLPFDALALFEPPHRRKELSRRPLKPGQLRRHCNVMALVTTHGCKFHCPYCPIPAYNQFTFRRKSPERMVEEIAGIARQTGIRFFFGTDDNFFNNRDAAAETLTAMTHGTVGRKRFRDAIFFGTEATEFDVFKNQDLLPLARDAGLRALWFGIEDMTAQLVKKGQSAEKTQTLFRQLLRHGIAPMPMMMHHDGQPLWSRRGLYGLLNQVRFLRRAEALSMQVTFLTPIPGSQSDEDTFEKGVVMAQAGGELVEDYQFDGNHCVATRDRHPWRKQLNLALSYASFYNPLNLLRAIFKFDSLWAYRVGYQVYGMLGLAKSLLQQRSWLRRLASGQFKRHAAPPAPKFPIASVETSNEIAGVSIIAPSGGLCRTSNSSTALSTASMDRTGSSL